MGGDPLALAEQFDGARRDAGLDLLAREAPGNGVIMPFDLDVVIQAGAPDPPFGEDIALRRQQPERRAVDLLEQLPPCAPDTAQYPAIVQIGQQLADRRIDLGQAAKDAMTQPTQKPAFDNAHRRLDLRLVPRTTGRVGSTELP
jgi:hypothetical protein